VISLWFQKQAASGEGGCAVPSACSNATTKVLYLWALAYCTRWPCNLHPSPLHVSLNSGRECAGFWRPGRQGADCARPSFITLARRQCRFKLVEGRQVLLQRNQALVGDLQPQGRFRSRGGSHNQAAQEVGGRKVVEGFPEGRKPVGSAI
jgi:hypothetical protein